MAVFATTRLEAFSDAVISIVITIMVLQLSPPGGVTLASLQPLLPTFLSYVLSFIYLAIYWNNHHHLLQATEQINGRIMWANMHLLLWLSLFPFVTAWVGQTHNAPWPTAVYGVVFLLAALAFLILQNTILATVGADSALAKALRCRWKEQLSLACYMGAIGFAFLHTAISNALYILVALLWLVPDKRIEDLD